MRSYRKFLCLPNNDLKTGLFGVDVDKVLIAFQWYDRNFIHTGRHSRGLFESMSVKRAEDGEIILHFPSYKPVPEGILGTIAYRVKEVMEALSNCIEGGPVTGTNYDNFLDEEIGVNFGDPNHQYLYFTDYRPDLKILRGNVLKITIGYVRALYEILKKRDENSIINRYGEDIVEQIKGVRYNGFVQGAVSELREEIDKLIKERREIEDQLSRECDREINAERDKIYAKYKVIKAEKTGSISNRILALEKDIQQMIEESAVGI